VVAPKSSRTRALRHSFLQYTAFQQLYTFASIHHTVVQSTSLFTETQSSKPLEACCILEVTIHYLFLYLQKQIKIAQCETGTVWWAGKHYSAKLGDVLLYMQ
jgi:hypothetical protein